jgi:predicted RNase H-like HicB family nuclease
MHNTYTAVIKQDGDWWIGWIEEIPGVNCQESTKEELLETLRVTLGEAIVLNREEALRSAESGYVEETLQVRM